MSYLLIFFFLLVGCSSGLNPKITFIAPPKVRDITSYNRPTIHEISYGLCGDQICMTVPEFNKETQNLISLYSYIKTLEVLKDYFRRLQISEENK